MKVYFSLLYVEWRRWMPKNVIECWLKYKNRYWIWFMCKCSLFRANECIFALLHWSPFHANECVFSFNEQQKVYYRIWTVLKGNYVTKTSATSWRRNRNQCNVVQILWNKLFSREREVRRPSVTVHLETRISRVFLHVTNSHRLSFLYPACKSLNVTKNSIPWVSSGRLRND